jgi:hypothetical protein
MSVEKVMESIEIFRVDSWSLIQKSCVEQAAREVGFGIEETNEEGKDCLVVHEDGVNDIQFFHRIAELLAKSS